MHQVLQPNIFASYQSNLFHLSFTHEADRAFHMLKELFTSVPILSYPYPSWQYILRVDDAGSAIGAVLSQHTEVDGSLTHVLFSHCLSSAKLNFDVGDQELLAIKLSLEEWNWREMNNHLLYRLTTKT